MVVSPTDGAREPVAELVGLGLGVAAGGNHTHDRGVDGGAEGGEGREHHHWGTALRRPRAASPHDKQAEARVFGTFKDLS